MLRSCSHLKHMAWRAYELWLSWQKLGRGIENHARCFIRERARDAQFTANILLART